MGQGIGRDLLDAILDRLACSGLLHACSSPPIGARRGRRRKGRRQVAPRQQAVQERGQAESLRLHGAVPAPESGAQRSTLPVSRSSNASGRLRVDDAFRCSQRAARTARGVMSPSRRAPARRPDALYGPGFATLLLAGAPTPLGRVAHCVRLPSSTSLEY
jgi:hypothetical protein